MNIEEIANRTTIVYGGPGSVGHETVTLPEQEYVIEFVNVEVGITHKEGSSETYTLDLDALEGHGSSRRV